MLVKMNNVNFRVYMYIKSYMICKMNEYHIMKNSLTKSTLFQPAFPEMAWLTADVIIAH